MFADVQDTDVPEVKGEEDGQSKENRGNMKGKRRDKR